MAKGLSNPQNICEIISCHSYEFLHFYAVFCWYCCCSFILVLFTTDFRWLRRWNEWSFNQDKNIYCGIGSHLSWQLIQYKFAYVCVCVWVRYVLSMYFRFDIYTILLLFFGWVGSLWGLNFKEQIKSFIKWQTFIVTKKWNIVHVYCLANEGGVSGGEFVSFFCNGWWVRRCVRVFMRILKQVKIP